MALRFGPNSARNRNTSLIRRISALGRGTTATPPKRWDSSRDYFDVSGGSLHQRTGEFTGLRWRFRPASGGDYLRPVQRDHKTAALRFLTNPEVPFTNNQAERA